MEKKTNRLIKEDSPYLLQHAYNPVDWYPWKAEAFDKAKKENKPIFLSIGYSSCHWCHVMEKESFEDYDVAKVLNSGFVSIKVDKEERPDIDKDYMLVVQMFTGSGGWPMTILMTPEKKPFYADTYIPKMTKYGKLGLIDLLNQILKLWEEDSYKISDTIKNFDSSIKKLKKSKPGAARIDETVFDFAFDSLRSSYDPYFGGFGTRMKFPTIHNLIFLLKYNRIKDKRDALDMVESTLVNMRKGGIWDHIGHGFHRYSTDRKWILPHFEKMLYDQALNLSAYLETYKSTGDDIYIKTAQEISEYVIEEMCDHSGGFYTAEDADSDGEEGKFYTWEYAELSNLLNEKDFKFISKRFNLEPEGNFMDEATKKKEGKNIFYLEELLREEEIESFEKIRNKLKTYRSKRKRPFKDKKILTDWNSLMISAFSKLYKVSGNDKYLKTARSAMDNLLSDFVGKNGRLLHLKNPKSVDVNANLDDYSFNIMALLDLYEVSFNQEYLLSAIRFIKIQIEDFWDSSYGGFFFTPDQSEEIIIRQKEIYDSAIPSGNSISAENLMRIYALTGNKYYKGLAERLIESFSSEIKSYPQNSTQMLSSIYYLFSEPTEIVICYDSKKDGQPFSIVRKIEEEIYHRHKVFIYKDISDKDSRISEVAPFIKDMGLIDEKTTIYLCTESTCKKPTNKVEEVIDILKKEK